MGIAREIARLRPNSSGLLPNANIEAMAATKLTGTVPDANAPSGSVIQVVSSVLSSSFSTASGSDQDTGLNASITPLSSSNKILIIVSTMLRATGSGNCYVYQKVWRGAIGSGTLLLDGYPMVGSSNTDHRGVGNFTYLDSPSTTSSVTYRISIHSGFAGSGVYINSTTTPSTLTLMEIAA